MCEIITFEKIVELTILRYYNFVIAYINSLQRQTRLFIKLKWEEKAKRKNTERPDRKFVQKELRSLFFLLKKIVVRFGQFIRLVHIFNRMTLQSEYKCFINTSVRQINYEFI